MFLEQIYFICLHSTNFLYCSLISCFPSFQSCYFSVLLLSFSPLQNQTKTKQNKKTGEEEGGKEEQEGKGGLPVYHFNYTISSHAPAHNVNFKQSSVSFKNILVMSEAWICCLLVPPCSSGLFSSPCCVFLLFSLWLRCVNHSLPAIGWRVCVKKLPERRFLSKSP